MSGNGRVRERFVTARQNFGPRAMLIFVPLATFYFENNKLRTVLRNNMIQLDENFLRVHPDLAALYREVQNKKTALKNLKIRKAILKKQLKSTQRELEQRLASLEKFQMSGAKAAKPVRRRRTRASS